MAKKVDPFSKLSPEFRDALAGATTDELKVKLSEVAKDEEANKSAKNADEDLNSLKKQVKVASEGYLEVTKRNRLKIKFIIRLLAENGDPVASAIIQNDASAAMQKR